MWSTFDWTDWNCSRFCSFTWLMFRDSLHLGKSEWVRQRELNWKTELHLVKYKKSYTESSIVRGWSLSQLRVAEYTLDHHRLITGVHTVNRDRYSTCINAPQMTCNSQKILKMLNLTLLTKMCFDSAFTCHVFKKKILPLQSTVHQNILHYVLYPSLITRLASVIKAMVGRLLTALSHHWAVRAVFRVTSGFSFQSAQDELTARHSRREWGE